jgi:hypothetical protein
MRRPGEPAGGRPAIGTAALSLSDPDAARIEAGTCRPPSDVAIPVTHWSAAVLGEHVRAQGIDVSLDVSPQVVAHCWPYFGRAALAWHLRA